jgi:prepilin-type N-terminal cleavage/methylation domain-containing protein
MRRHAWAEAGFTLVELLVVLAIIAFAGAIVGGAVQRAGSSNQRREEIAALDRLFEAARSAAIADERPTPLWGLPDGWRSEQDRWAARTLRPIVARDGEIVLFDRDGMMVGDAPLFEMDGEIWVYADDSFGHAALQKVEQFRRARLNRRTGP